MANTKRRLPNIEGKMFIPYNIGGGGGDDHFISGGKLGLIAAVAVVNVLLLLNEYDSAGIIKSILFTIFILLVDSIIIRLFVLDERYYYKAYKRLEDYKVTTPASFWDIASIHDTDGGAQLTYSDLKTAMMVRLERDTITGKAEEFREQHFDAISDFYKLLNLNGYSFVQINVMEQAGNDPRLKELDKLTIKSKNANISKLMELQVAYIKTITRATLYESEYFLIYTRDQEKARYMSSEINDILYKILDGAYVGFRIMEAQEIMEFVREMYGVKLFNPSEAMLKVFSRTNQNVGIPFEIHVIHHIDGTDEVKELMEERLQRMREAKSNKKNKKAVKNVENTGAGTSGIKTNMSLDSKNQNQSVGGSVNNNGVNGNVPQGGKKAKPEKQKKGFGLGKKKQENTSPAQQQNVDTGEAVSWGDEFDNYDIDLGDTNVQSNVATGGTNVVNGGTDYGQAQQSQDLETPEMKPVAISNKFLQGGKEEKPQKQKKEKKSLFGNGKKNKVTPQQAQQNTQNPNMDFGAEIDLGGNGMNGNAGVPVVNPDNPQTYRVQGFNTPQGQQQTGYGMGTQGVQGQNGLGGQGWNRPPEGPQGAQNGRSMNYGVGSGQGGFESQRGPQVGQGANKAQSGYGLSDIDRQNLGGVVRTDREYGGSDVRQIMNDNKKQATDNRSSVGQDFDSIYGEPPKQTTGERKSIVQGPVQPQQQGQQQPNYGYNTQVDDFNDDEEIDL